MRINLSQIGYTLAIASDLFAIVAEATHKADQVLEKNRVVAAIDLISSGDENNA